MTTAICAGSFNPITMGHMDIIRRTADLFDSVRVVVVFNSNKKCIFTLEERLEHLRKVTADLPNVQVDSWDGLLVEYAARFPHPVIVRGLRAMSDFEYEFQMAHMNKKLDSRVETFFMAASEKYTYLSSSAVRELGAYGCDISEFIPPEILSEVSERCVKQNQ